MIIIIVLKVEHLVKSYGDKTVINDISFTVKEGEIVLLVGPEKAGKTMLFRMIANLIPATSGEIFIRDIPIQNRKESLKQMAAMIDPDSAYENMSGLANLELYAALKGIPKNEIGNVMTLFGLKDVQKKKVKTYSASMRQRLGIAACMLQKPKLMLFDEPANELDEQETANLIQQLLKEKEKKTAILISSQTLNKMQSIADRVLFIKNGKLIMNIENKESRNLEQIYRENDTNLV